MSAVFLDGEQVDFQGRAPGSAAEVWDAIESYLGDRGRAVVEASVDGRAWSPQAGEDCAAFGRMELRSASLASQLAALGRRWIGERAALLAEMAEISRFALSHAWADTQAKSLALFEAIGPAIQGAALLTDFAQRREYEWSASLADEYRRCIEGLERVAQATQEGDCVALSDALALDLGPAWERLLGRLEESALETLEADG